jgi:hypothetical protein
MATLISGYTTTQHFQLLITTLQLYHREILQLLQDPIKAMMPRLVIKNYAL